MGYYSYTYPAIAGSGLSIAVVVGLYLLLTGASPRRLRPR